MYSFLGWEAPEYAHLPLILKPTGKGKLSKRDGAKFGFPVFPLSWEADTEEDSFIGFKEAGFLPGALLNFLAFLGWNPGTEQEIFSLDELVHAFTTEKIVKSGARFDFDKAKWFNQQYIIAQDNDDLVKIIRPYVEEAGYKATDNFLSLFAGLMKERVESINEFVPNAYYFFERPTSYDEKMVRKKYKPENKDAFETLAKIIEEYTGDSLAETVKSYITSHGFGFGAILPVLRLSIAGTMQGPDLFETMELLGRKESAERIRVFLEKQN
jgi:glutamyl-tRNA synthetase